MLQQGALDARSVRRVADDDGRHLREEGGGEEGVEFREVSDVESHGVFVG